VPHAPGDQLGLPAHGRGLEPLELLEHGEQARLAAQLGARRHVLPSQKEPHQVLRRGRPDGLAPRAP
jgi:hypothetical protein